jgi:(p)ppGpp synthase/HD superfamily hydrolase
MQITLLTISRRLSEEAHRNQFRRGGKPYYVHPNRVGWAAFEKHDILHAVVGFLHDTLEDTTLTSDDMVASGIPLECILAVEALTKKEGEDYDAYLKRVKDLPMARNVKVIDILDNLNDSPTNNQILKYTKALQYLLSES